MEGAAHFSGTLSSVADGSFLEYCFNTIGIMREK
jgi:hypothetical protein